MNNWKDEPCSVPGCPNKMGNHEKRLCYAHYQRATKSSNGLNAEAPLRKPHGQYYTRTYRKWIDMKQRCLNPKTTGHYRYGGRGIKVCKRWLKFENFFEDMGECPPGLTLHRVENDGNYEKANCKWATTAEQNANTSRNKYLTFQGRTMHVAAWERELGTGVGTIAKRLRLGWSIEEALTISPNLNNANFRRALDPAGSHTPCSPEAASPPSQ